jgi:hypothetical protein
VYRDRSDKDIRDIAIVRRTAGGWSAPTIVHNDGWYYPGCPVNGPSVVAHGDTVVVAWFTQARDTAKVQIARSTDGGATFAAPTRVDDGDPIGRVDLALATINGRARVVAAWIERTSADEADVRVRQFDGAQRSPATVVGTISAGRQSGFPRVAVIGGRALVAWTGTPADSSARTRVQLSALNLNSTP